jgi:hypothetical protein
MSIKTVIKNHHIFENNIENIIRYAQELIADLPYQKTVPPKEKEMLLESLLLRACALWESFIEREIILLTNLDPSQLIRKFGLPVKGDLNIRLIRAIIFSDSFRDFHDLDRSIAFFEEVISTKFNAFKAITSDQKTKIIFTYKIRNYLAHYSEFSKMKLFHAYQKEPYKYKIFLEPGKFLLKHKGTHFERLLNNFRMVSIQMRTSFKGGPSWKI